MEDHGNDYVVTLLASDFEDADSSQLFESLCDLEPPEEPDGMFGSIDLHLECDDDDNNLDLIQAQYTEETNILSHSVIGQNVHLRVTFPVPKDDIDSKSSSVFKCKECSSEFEKQFKLAKHLQSVHGVIKSFQCQECPFATTSRRLLTRHQKRGHVKRKEFKSQKIKETKTNHPFEEKQSVGTLLSDLNAGSSSLEKTETSFGVSQTGSSLGVPQTGFGLGVQSPTTTLTSSVTDTCSEGRFQCLDVDISPSHSCRDNSLPGLGVQTHNDKTKPTNCLFGYKCPRENCDRVFKSKDVLKNHVSRLHDKKVRKSTFPCTWEGCNKKFRDNHNLRAHYCHHTGDKPIQCQHCDFRCAQKASLNHHMRKTHNLLNK